MFKKYVIAVNTGYETRLDGSKVVALGFEKPQWLTSVEKDIVTFHQVTNEKNKFLEYNSRGMANKILLQVKDVTSEMNKIRQRANQSTYEFEFEIVEI